MGVGAGGGAGAGAGAGAWTGRVNDDDANVSPANPAVYPHSSNGPGDAGVRPNGIENAPVPSMLICTSHARSAPPVPVANPPAADCVAGHVGTTLGRNSSTSK
jgi:hypothetical protein